MILVSSQINEQFTIAKAQPNMNRITSLLLSLTLLLTTGISGIGNVSAQNKPAVKPVVPKAAPAKTTKPTGGVANAPAGMAGKLDRSKKPGAGPAPAIRLASAQEFTLENGLRVFVVTNTKLPRVAYNLVLEYEPILEGPSAGYVEMAGELIGQGTKTRTKDVLNDEIDFMGASISTSPSGVYATGLSRYADKLMELTADIILNASMPTDELEKIRTKRLSGLAASKSDPQAIASRVSNRLMFSTNHPYGEIEDEATVKAVTLAKCQEFYANYYRPNIAYLAIVGNITLSDAKALVTKNLAKWERSNVPSRSIMLPIPPKGPVIALVNKPGAVQSIISIASAQDIKPNNKELFKLRVANEILGGGSSARLFTNLRERHGWTYGAYSRITPDKYAGRFTAQASVRTAVTDSAISEFLAEMSRITTKSPSDSELILSRNGLSGSFIQSLEQPQTLANFAINTVRYDLPATYYTNYVKSIASVTAAEVQSSITQIVNDKQMYILVVGDAPALEAKLAKFGQVVVLDDMGNPAQLSKLKEVPVGITAQSVADKYIAAIGGAPAIAKVKDMVLTYKGEIQEQPLTLDLYMKAPNMRTLVLAAAGREMQRTASNGTTINEKNMAGSRKKEGKELENALATQYLYWERDVAARGMKAELAGLETINAVESYKVNYTQKSGDVFTDYYAMQTGLKIRHVETRQTPQGPTSVQVDYADYRKEGDIMVPATMIQQLGPMSLEMKLSSAAINKGIKDSVFE
jgi:zinc protease